MATWSEVEKAVPDLAAAVQAVFDAHKHKVLATLRADGSPRVSGNEAVFRDGEVWLGMMRRSVKNSSKGLKLTDSSARPTPTMIV